MNRSCRFSGQHAWVKALLVILLSPLAKRNCRVRMLCSVLLPSSLQLNHPPSLSCNPEFVGGIRADYWPPLSSLVESRKTEGRLALDVLAASKPRRLPPGVQSHKQVSYVPYHPHRSAELTAKPSPSPINGEGIYYNPLGFPPSMGGTKAESESMRPENLFPEFLRPDTIPWHYRVRNPWQNMWSGRVWRQPYHLPLRCP